jgi:hypothetical protein
MSLGWRCSGGGIDPGRSVGFRRWMQAVLPRCREAFSTEFRPCVTQEDISVETFKETKTFIVLAWLFHTLTISHILYGTLIFSSLSFIGTRDATLVLGRFMVSVLLCRIVLMYDITGLRKVYLRSNPEMAEPTVLLIRENTPGKGLSLQRSED